MNTSNFHPFSHRYSNDCVESICKHCFFSVARARREIDLERFERQHACDPVMMDWFERVSPFPSDCHPLTKKTNQRRGNFPTASTATNL